MQRWSLFMLVSIAAAENTPIPSFNFQHFRLDDYLQVLTIRADNEAVQVVSQGWFEEQKVDHTDPTNTAVWKQQYLFNDQFYGGPGSPVFLYISGEDAIAMTLEHRYYGKSQPVTDWSIDKLKYLHSEQALADITTFQDYVIQAKNLSSSTRWVAFGGSYAGSLAAWLKVKYPTRFAGDVASSAPLQAHADFSAYSDVLSDDVKIIGGLNCAKSLREGLAELHRLVASSNCNDTATLRLLFNPCASFQSDDDRGIMEYAIYMNIIAKAQYAPENFMSFCTSYMAHPALTPIQRLARYISSSTNSSCAYSSYAGYLSDLNGTTINSTDWIRQWMYQTCREFGFAEGTATATGVFSPLKYITTNLLLHKMCKSIYNITDVDANIAATNQRYGGFKINVENVVFPSSSYDPWSALALNNSTGVVNPKSQVVSIQGGSHCRDMYARRSNDSVPLAWAHDQIQAAVQRYLT
ncbi:hypothetical protein Ae201684P_004073 [Aphanomyces euteiches]|uniref:Uncharacterized protein n=1 Tax=Aphanomyces euteiches TaxID=100861 RepID=A0A6G0XUG2_9STRA|nr:hypothetical protein Ae201684_001676 [Aphanomyces euteiches]KAH9075393.1 hypothetical protein Ae201684P_004073 [Aphanomyces euteiches]KAH9135990.1 hypothetical protein AeRB84_018710 [Aphanomyces euteiches]